MANEYIEIRLRVYRHADADLVNWYENLPGDHGLKAAAARAALRKGITAQTKPAALDEAILNHLRRLPDAAAVRAMLDAAIASVPFAAAPTAPASAPSDFGDALISELLL